MTMNNLKFHLATKEDLPKIIELLADDELGKKRENYQLPLPKEYIEAYKNISSDLNQELTVALLDKEVVGCFHLSFIQYLTYQGGIRAQIEAVRTKSTFRGKGIGNKMFLYAIDQAKNRGAHVLQLTTDKKRPDAKHFYEALGFVPSHEGMKLHF